MDTDLLILLQLKKKKKKKAIKSNKVSLIKDTKAAPFFAY